MITLAACLLFAPALEDVQVQEHLGAQVPLELSFTDEQGRAVRLADYVRGDKPVLLVLAYYHCPMLCGLVLRGAAAALQASSFLPEQQYRVLTISFDPKDGPAEAQRRQAQALEVLGKGAAAHWPFLTTGDPESLSKLSRALGFAAVKVPETGEYAHPAVIFVLTPEGRISRYLYGITYPERDLELALLEAGAGKTGSTLERLVMRCYAYDPATRRYQPIIGGILRLGGLAVFLALTGMVVTLWRRDRNA